MSLLHGVQDCDGAALVPDRITRRFPCIDRFFADAGHQGPRVAAAAPRPVEIIERADDGFVVQPRRRVIARTFAWPLTCGWTGPSPPRDATRPGEPAGRLEEIGPRQSRLGAGQYS